MVIVTAFDWTATHPASTRTGRQMPASTCSPPPPCRHGNECIVDSARLRKRRKSMRRRMRSSRVMRRKDPRRKAKRSPRKQRTRHLGWVVWHRYPTSLLISHYSTDFTFHFKWTHICYFNIMHIGVWSASKGQTIHQQRSVQWVQTLTLDHWCHSQEVSFCSPNGRWGIYWHWDLCFYSTMASWY